MGGAFSKGYCEDMSVLLLGDCLDLMNDIDDHSIDMIKTDLPYGTTRCNWDIVIPFEKLWAQYKRIIKPNGAIVLNGAEPFSSFLRISNIEWYKYDWVWDKVKGTGYLNAKKQPMRNHEIVSVFYQKQCTYNPQKTSGHVRKSAFKGAHLQSPTYGAVKNGVTYDSTDRYPRSIQIFSTDTQKSALHTSQKPVALEEFLIKTYTNEGETVLDSCAGSGTTAEACLNINRKYICMEKDPKIFEVMKNRILKHN